VTYLRTSLFNPDYRITEFRYNETARRRFRWGIFKFSIVFGLVGAYLTTDSSYFIDHINTRSDLSTRRTMMPQERLPVKEKKILDMIQGDYFGDAWNEKNNSIWKKTLNYFYPYRDYNPDRAYIEPFFDYKTEPVPEEFKHHYHFDV
jgi:hypothetical protein